MDKMKMYLQTINETRMQDLLLKGVQMYVELLQIRCRHKLIIMNQEHFHSRREVVLSWVRLMFQNQISNLVKMWARNKRRHRFFNQVLKIFPMMIVRLQL